MERAHARRDTTTGGFGIREGVPTPGHTHLTCASHSNRWFVTRATGEGFRGSARAAHAAVGIGRSLGGALDARRARARSRRRARSRLPTTSSTGFHWLSEPFSPQVSSSGEAFMLQMTMNDRSYERRIFSVLPSHIFWLVPRKILLVPRHLTGLSPSCPTCKN